MLKTYYYRTPTDKGLITAYDPEELKIKLPPLASATNISHLGKRLSSKQLQLLLTTLCRLQSSKLSLLHSLHHIAHHNRSVKVSYVCHQLGLKLSEGQSFAESLEPFVTPKSQNIIQILEAAQASGQWLSVVQSLLQTLEKHATLKRLLMRQLSYPLFLLTACLFFLGYFIVSLLPRFKVIFESFHAPLPPLAEALLGLPAFCHSVPFLGGIGACLLLFYSVKRYAGSRVCLAIPGLRYCYQSWFSIQFASFLGICLSAHLPLTKALWLTSLSMRTGEAAVLKMLTQIQQGNPVAVVLLDSNYFRADLKETLSLALTQSEQGLSLQQWANDTQDSLFHLWEQQLQKVGPLCILGVGCVLGVILIGIYQPIFELGMVL